MIPTSTSFELPTLLELALAHLGLALQASFALISWREGESLSFPYTWGELPSEVQAFVSRGRVPIAESALATTLIETSSAYYSETSYHQEGETRLKSLAFMVAAEPVKTAGAKVIAFINVGREPRLGPWIESERDLLRRSATDFAKLVEQHSSSKSEPTSETRLKGLLQVSSSLAQALTPNDVYETVLTQSIRVLGMRAGAVTILRADNHLEIISAQGQPQHVIEAQRVIELTANHPLADTVRGQQALYFADAESRNRRYPHLTSLFSPATRSSAFVPILSEGQAVGVLTLSFPKRHAFDADERAFIEALADVCARALERAKTFEQEHLAKEHYQTLFNSVDEGFCIFEMLLDDAGQAYDYRFLEVNPKFEEHTGLKDAIGKTAKELVPNLEQHWVDIYGTIARTGQSIRFEQGSAAMDRYFEVYGTRVGGADSRKVALLFKDVSEKKRAEEALQESQRFLATVTDAVPNLTYVYELETRQTLFVNNRLTHLFGYTLDDIGALGPDYFTQLLHPEDLSKLETWRKQAGELADGKVLETEYRFLHKDTSWKWVQAKEIVFKRHGDGSVWQMLGVLEDITERKYWSEQLQSTNARFQLAEEAAHSFSYEWNLATDVVQRSPNLQQVLGYAPGELGDTWEAWAALYHPGDLQVRSKAESMTFLKSYPTDTYGYEYRARHRNGHYLWLHERGLLIRDKNGEVQRVIGQTVDISERKQTEDALKEADRRKDEFLATLAHELRNPLAPIRMSLEIMNLTKDSATQQEALATIRRQTNQIIRLVDDLLDVSRITRGKIKLLKERVVLAEVIEMALESARPLIAERTHQLVVSLPAKQIWLEGDKTRLCQIFLNLLTNAAKYSDPGSQISLSASQQNHEVVVRVRDTGIGIVPEMLPRVFELFARIESGEAAQREGLGIGLHLVKRLVEMHGGYIEASSGGLGGGSEFTVHLPALEADLQEADLPAEHEAKKAKVSRRVLVVDDYEANLKTLSRMLRLMGHEVKEAADGYKALELLGNFTPDLILLDINMPGLSGYEVAIRIRENPRYQGITLAALTGYGTEEDVQRANEAGFHQHLVKPVNIGVLEELLRTLQPISSPGDNLF